MENIWYRVSGCIILSFAAFISVMFALTLIDGEMGVLIIAPIIIFLFIQGIFYLTFFNKDTNNKLVDRSLIYSIIGVAMYVVPILFFELFICQSKNFGGCGMEGIVLVPFVILSLVSYVIGAIYLMRHWFKNRKS
jgi:hypothetical protein